MKEKLVGVNAQIDKTEEKMCEPEAQAQELFKMKNIWGKKKATATGSYGKTSGGSNYMQVHTLYSPKGDAK